jgi:hypothetical protein
MPSQHHHQQDLNKALNIGLLALVGAIIPVVGVILAIVAERLARSVPTTDKTAGKKETVQTLAVLAFLLSVGCGIFTTPFTAARRSKLNRSRLRKRKPNILQCSRRLRSSGSRQADYSEAGVATYPLYLTIVSHWRMLLT